jgi:hypothetical protein
MLAKQLILLIFNRILGEVYSVRGLPCRGYVFLINIFFNKKGFAHIKATLQTV